MKSTLAIFGSVLLLISATLRLSQSPQQQQLTAAPAPRQVAMGRLLLTTAEPELAARLAESASWQLLLKRVPASHGKLLLTHEGNGLLWRWETQPAIEYTDAPDVWRRPEQRWYCPENRPLTNSELARVGCLAMAGGPNAAVFLPVLWHHYSEDRQANFIIIRYLAHFAPETLARLPERSLELLQFAEIATSDVPELLMALEAGGRQAADAVLALASQDSVDLALIDRQALATAVAPYLLRALPLAPGARRLFAADATPAERACQGMAARALLALGEPGIRALMNAEPDSAPALEWALPQAVQRDSRAVLDGLANADAPTWIAAEFATALVPAIEQCPDFGLLSPENLRTESLSCRATFLRLLCEGAPKTPGLQEPVADLLESPDPSLSRMAMTMSEMLGLALPAEVLNRRARVELDWVERQGLAEVPAPQLASERSGEFSQLLAGLGVLRDDSKSPLQQFMEFGAEQPQVVARATGNPLLQALPTELVYAAFYSAGLRSESSAYAADLLMSLLAPIADNYAKSAEQALTISIQEPWPNDHAIRDADLQAAVRRWLDDEGVAPFARAILFDSGLAPLGANE
jgi:hypothetical protein